MIEPLPNILGRLRVVGVSTSYPVRADSVAGIFVHRLYRELALTCDVKAICPGDSNGGYDTGIQGVQVHAVDYAPKRFRVLGGAGGILPALSESPIKLLLLPGLLAGLFIAVMKHAKSADIIHANWAVCGALAGLAGKLAGRPVVTTLRGDDVTRSKKSIIDRLLLNCAVRWSGKIICVSEPMAEQLGSRYPGRKPDIYSCLNGVDESFFNIEHINNPTSELRIVSIGSLIYRKGYDLLIKAVAECPQRASLKVKIIGEGPQRDELKSLCNSLGIADRIEFLGELNQDAVRQELSHSDVFVLASRSEGRPNALIEAVAAGLPAISSGLDGVQGLVEHGINGWIFPVEDIGQLKDSLGSAINNREALHGMGRIGRQNLASGSDWAQAAKRYVGVFENALAEWGKP